MTRSLHVKDAPRMAEIHAQSFFKSWPVDEMETHLQKDLCLGRGRPLDGFIILRHANDQAEILTLAIDPSMRRQGLARDLLDIAETELAELGIDTLFLEVAEDNDPAIVFYKKSGFDPIGKRPAYYKREKGRIAALTFRKQMCGTRFADDRSTQSYCEGFV